MPTKIQVRRGLASEWSAANPTLSEGEVGFERDTAKFKIGDGVTAWNSLTYSVTKSLAGLSNVDNTADSAKPVSTATQTALNAKANIASPTFTGTVGGVTKSMVGLANVDNTSDLAKPVSTAQQAAIDSASGTTTTENIQDAVAPMFTGGAHTGISFTYDDTGNVVNAVVSGTGGTGNIPWLVRPSSSTVDAGPLIQTALNTYGAALIAPGSWALNTKVQLAQGQSIIGYGPEASTLVSGTALTSGGMIEMATGTSAHCWVQGLKLNANGRTPYGVYFYATAAPGGQTTPDFVHTIQDCHVRGATIDGIYVGGDNAYSGNCRETRVRNCLVTANGGWGVTISSSDCFISDVTVHGNGPGGFRTISGVSGNTKFNHCKAYFEVIGIDAVASRTSIVGGEVQDCDTGIRLGTDGYLATVIDSCGLTNNSTAGLVINGSGSTFAVHMCRRTISSSTAQGTVAIQLTGTTFVLDGFISTGVNRARATDYQTIYLGSNRATAASTLTVS